MARYGREYGRAGYYGHGEEFAGQGESGTWTHVGRGHGRGGWIDPEQDWRNNWNALAGGGRRRMGPPSYFSVGGRYLGEWYGADYRDRRAGGYGGGYGRDFRRGRERGGYRGGW